MRAINIILLLAAFIALSDSRSLRARQHVAHPEESDLENSMPESQAELEALLKEHLSEAKTHGAKEVFVYNPQINRTAKQGRIGSLPKELELEDAAETDADSTAIRPNFKDADLENFINFVAQLTKINVIPTKDTQGVKVSLNMRTDLTKKEVWEVFLTVTEMAGFTINKSGNVYKVLRQDSKKTEPLPAYINVPASSLPDSDQSIRFVTFLRNIQASEVEALLKGMLGSGGDLLRQDNVNGFIITDKCNNIKSAMTILNELDDAGLQEVVSVLPLKKTDATEVKTLLDNMTKNAGDKSNNAIVARLLGKTQESSEYFSAATKIIVEDRSNSLILLGNQKSIKKIEDFVAKYIEREDTVCESPIHRYQLKFNDASTFKTLLDNIVNTQTESGTEKLGGVRNGGKYFKRMRFEVDKDSNSLLVSCLDPNDWKLLKKTIRDLDKPQAQVSIETLVVDINLQDIKELGGQIRSPRADQPFPNITWQSAGLTSAVQGGSPGSRNLVGDLGSILGSLSQGVSAFALSKGVGNVWAVFRALNQTTNASLVDNSFITISNRVPGTLSVGETRRVVTQQYSGPSGQAPSYGNQNASTSYSYTPQINSDGLINLNVNITMNSFIDTNGGQSTKNFKSTLSCANGQILVLGGFVKTKSTEAKTNGMPLLSEIPVLGWLFKDKNRTVTKTYTFFFICPTILKPRQKPGADIYTKMKLHRARREVENSILTANCVDPIHNIFFNGEKENYHHKVDDFANARFQPSTVDIRHDPFYNPGILDKTRIDFNDDYEDNKIAQALAQAEALASGETPSKEQNPNADKEPLKQAPPAELQNPCQAAPKEDSIINKLTKKLKSSPKEKVEKPSLAINIPQLPPISHEKRLKFKEVFETPTTTSTELSESDLWKRRNALKQLLSSNPKPVKTAPTPSVVEQENTLSEVSSTKQHTPDPVDELVAEQEAKRNKFKETLTLGDKNSKPIEAPLAARRRSLKELLASYPSTKDGVKPHSQTLQREG